MDVVRQDMRVVGVAEEDAEARVMDDLLWQP